MKLTTFHSMVTVKTLGSRLRGAVLCLCGSSVHLKSAIRMDSLPSLAARREARMDSLPSFAAGVKFGWLQLL
jgi:hypothetical protein